MSRLRRARPADPGIRRIGRGRGYSYAAPDGAPVREPLVLARIRDLAIPPAWTDVWIAAHERDHIQATGVDAAGRRQYLYHAAWRRRQDRRKFDRLLELAAVLPAARRGVSRHLRAEGLERDRVLAGAFRLLDAGGVRVGSQRYTDEHGSYGLTTLLVAHATVSGDRVELRFPAKGGQAWACELDDPDLAALVADLGHRGRRARLLAWRDDDGARHALRPEEINDDIRRRTGGDFTAKDFRTLRGTAAAALALARTGPRGTESARRRAVAAAMRSAAEVLGNTPAIARGSYVDPRLVDRYEHGEHVDPARPRSVESQLIELLGG